MSSRIIAKRAFEFACRIVKLCERLWQNGPAARKIANQLFDSGTSIGANAEEAVGGQTKADFLSKLAISRKESREVAWELDEAEQLRRMITSAIKTGQSSG
jgi:four helix bundle protein